MDKGEQWSVDIPILHAEERGGNIPGLLFTPNLILNLSQPTFALAFTKVDFPNQASC
jgi:hypothetical protein